MKWQASGNTIFHVINTSFDTPLYINTEIYNILHSYDDTNDEHILKFDRFNDKLSEIRLTKGMYTSGREYINVDINGAGGSFCGSQGMLGSWDHGNMHYLNEFSALTQYAEPLNFNEGGFNVAKLWSIKTNNILLSPSDICIDKEPCGPNYSFPCDASRKRSLGNLQSSCTKSCDELPNSHMKRMCKRDIELSGDEHGWACQKTYTDPIYFEADPCSFAENENGKFLRSHLSKPIKIIKDCE